MLKVNKAKVFPHTFPSVWPGADPIIAVLNGTALRRIHTYIHTNLYSAKIV